MLSEYDENMTITVASRDVYSPAIFFDKYGHMEEYGMTKNWRHERNDGHSYKQIDYQKV